MGRVVIPGFRKIETVVGGEGTGNYNDLQNKPSINNIPLVGNLNISDLKLTDSTLTEEGVPAEAKTVGTKLEEQYSNLTSEISRAKETEETLKSRIDNISSLPEGSTTGDAELQDIRVKADGTTATSAGNAVREQVSELKGDLGHVINIYENLVNPIFDTTFTHDTSSSSRTTISDIVNVKSGKTYLCYALIDVSNIDGYSTGNVAIDFLHGIDLGDCTDKIAGSHDYYFQNGKIELYGWKTANTDGTVKACIHTLNTANNYTFDFRVEKCYLIETSEDIIKLIEDTDYSERIVVSKIIDGSVTWENLSEDVKNRIVDENNTNIIDCWGDSLTNGAGSTNYSYPKKLQELVGDSFTVNNYGQGSEVAEAIAFRQGGLNAIIGAFTPSTSYVENEMLVSVNGEDLLSTLSYQGLYNGNNIVYIGSTPYLYRRISSNKCMLACATGNVPSAYTRPMMVRAEGKGTKHILIVCIGQNGWVNTDNHTLADVISKMIEHNKCDKYIVVGIPSGSKSSKEEQEKILSSCFGNHFVNAREYISTYGLSDSNLTPTEEDTSAMSEGKIPPQLRVDTVHMNDYGYIAMANCIYQRGVSLGYW